MDCRVPGISHGIDFLDQNEKDAFYNYPDLKGEPMDIETPFVQSVESDLELLQQMDESETQDITDLISRIEEIFLNSWDEPRDPVVNVKTFLFK